MDMRRGRWRGMKRRHLESHLVDAHKKRGGLKVLFGSNFDVQSRSKFALVTHMVYTYLELLFLCLPKAAGYLHDVVLQARSLHTLFRFHLFHSDCVGGGRVCSRLVCGSLWFEKIDSRARWLAPLRFASTSDPL